MSVQKDWTHDAAIAIHAFINLPHETSVDDIRDVIVEHCPFKPDVTYMEVEPGVAYQKVPPRDATPEFVECDNCRMKPGSPLLCNGCQHNRALIAQLLARPNPLLICIDCHNTESPAGAMARHFNRGRCMHCGGYFKVFSA